MNPFKFYVPRSTDSVNAELLARNTSVLFGYPNDFSVWKDAKGNLYIEQTYYGTVGSLPFIDGPLHKWFPAHAFQIDPTIMYSHMLELLLNTPDAPGEIIFSEGSVLKLAIYDREFAPAPLNMERFQSLYSTYTEQTRRVLARYFPTEKGVNFSHYERVFLQRLNVVMHQLGSETLRANAAFLLNTLKPFPGDARQFVPFNPGFDQMMKSVSLQVLAPKLFEKYRDRFFPQLSHVSNVFDQLYRAMHRDVPEYVPELFSRILERRFERVAEERIQQDIPGHSFLHAGVTARDVVLRNLTLYDKYVEMRVKRIMALERLAQDNDKYVSDLSKEELEFLRAHDMQNALKRVAQLKRLDDFIFQVQRQFVEDDDLVKRAQRLSKLLSDNLPAQIVQCSCGARVALICGHCAEEAYCSQTCAHSHWESGQHLKIEY